VLDLITKNQRRMTRDEAQVIVQPILRATDELVATLKNG
jgi:hypothetical protein